MVKKKKISMLFQIAILFLVGTVLVGGVLSVMVDAFVYANVRSDQTSHAKAVADEVLGYIDRFPARDWLIRYWYENYDRLDIEYDAPYSEDTRTAQKYRLLLERNPGFSPEYAGAQDAQALPEEDQKLYAEVMYSRLISHIDQLKHAHGAAYVFGVVTEEPHDRLFLLFISANPGDERGEGTGKIYPIGKELRVTEERREAIRDALAGETHLSNNEDEKFMDFFYPVGTFDGHEVLIAVTSSYSGLYDTIREQSRVLKALTMACLVILAVVCLLMILFTILRPLKKVQKSIRLYKDTKDSRTVAENLSGIRSRNEIAELTGDVAALTEELDEYMIRNGQITAEREHVRTELDLAGRIQAAMLPSEFPAYPDRKDFDIFASMAPAKNVGGDFYDFFLVDDSRLCLTMADVSGKGIPAALFMMAAKITLSHLIKSGRSPAQVLAEANVSICAKNPEKMFVTVWLGILDLSTGSMVCANAGHEYPMLKKPGGAYELLRDRHGFVLGGIDGSKYTEYEIRMEPGSALFLYTDGLPEAVDGENRMFGTDRIQETLNTDPDMSPEAALRAMEKAVDDHVQGTEPFDDLTMMCLTYRGPEPKSGPENHE